MAGIAFVNSELKMGDGATPTEVFTKVARVLSVGGLGQTLETDDATDLDSEGSREFVATLLDGGEVTVQVHFLPTHATHGPTTGLLKAQSDRRLVNFQWLFPGAATRWDFKAYIANVRVGGEIAGKISGDITLRTSGKNNFAPVI